MFQGIWNREELYAKVWAAPVVRVAKEYGVSDVAVAKACRKLKVPLPGRGYWAKKAHGHAVAKKPLPKLKEEIIVERLGPTVVPVCSPLNFTRMTRLNSVESTSWCHRGRSPLK